MKNGKIIIGLLTALLASVALLGLVLEPPVEEKGQLPLEILAGAGDQTERLQCWESPQGTYFVFLPEYIDPENTEICPLEGETQIEIEEHALTGPVRLSQFSLDTAYPVSYGEQETTLTFVSTGSIPTLHIDVASGSMDYIHMNKGNEESGVLRLYDTQGALLHSEAVASIKGRGNTSWASDKKPYNLELAQPADFFGMGMAHRWVLLAEGAYNVVNIRNKLVFDYAQAAGLPYTPQAEWVELYLNGEYAGLYLLCERNEILESRVDIAGEDYFLVSREDEWRINYAGYPYVRTREEQALRIHGSDMEGQALTDLWQSLENALLAEDGVDPVTGQSWQDMIDLDSWVRKFLLEEIFANNDAGALSQFFFRSGKEENGKICAGPVWDYDYAMGGYGTWLRSYTDYYVMNRLEKEEDDSVPWFYALYRRPEFYSRLRELYRSEFLPLMEALLDTGYEEYLQLSLPSQLTNGIRWGIAESDIRQELTYIRDFLAARMDFLSSVWLEEEHYCIVRVDIGQGNIYGHLAVRPGALVPGLSDSDSDGSLGWFYVDTGEPFDPSQPVYGDIEIYQAFPVFQIPKTTMAPAAALLVGLAALVAADRVRNGTARRKREEADECSANSVTS